MRAKKHPHNAPWGVFYLEFENGNGYSIINLVKMHKMMNIPFYLGEYEILPPDGDVVRADTVEELYMLAIEMEGRDG